MILYVSRSSGLSKTLICHKPCTDHCKAPLIIYIWKGRYISANLLLLLLNINNSNCDGKKMKNNVLLRTAFT